MNQTLTEPESKQSGQNMLHKQVTL